MGITPCATTGLLSSPALLGRPITLGRDPPSLGNTRRLSGVFERASCSSSPTHHPMGWPVLSAPRFIAYGHGRYGESERGASGSCSSRDCTAGSPGETPATLEPSAADRSSRVEDSKAPGDASRARVRCCPVCPDPRAEPPRLGYQLLARHRCEVLQAVDSSDLQPSRPLWGNLADHPALWPPRGPTAASVLRRMQNTRTCVTRRSGTSTVGMKYPAPCSPGAFPTPRRLP